MNTKKKDIIGVLEIDVFGPSFLMDVKAIYTAYVQKHAKDPYYYLCEINEIIIKLYHQVISKEEAFDKFNKLNQSLYNNYFEMESLDIFLRTLGYKEIDVDSTFSKPEELFEQYFLADTEKETIEYNPNTCKIVSILHPPYKIKYNNNDYILKGACLYSIIK